MPKVSVIVPMYNLEDYIEKCVESIVKQSYKNLEIILVDDGSKDGTFQKCKELASNDNRIILISQKNSGVSAARNAGLDIATGDFITFVDGDDIIDPNMVSILLEMFEEDNIILAACHTVKIHTYNYNFDYNKNYIVEENSKKVIERLLLEKLDMSACGKLYIKDKISNIRFEDGRKINEDKYFLFEYLNNTDGIVRELKGSLYGYYCRETSVTGEIFSKKHLDAIYFSTKIVDYYENNDLYFYQLAQYNLMASRFMVLKKMIRTKSVKQNKETFLNIKSDIKKSGLVKGINIRTIKKLEYYALSIHNNLYIMLVRVMDILKRKR